MKFLEKIKKYGFVNSLIILLGKIFVIKIMKFHYLKLHIDYQEALKHSKLIDEDVVELKFDDFLTADENIFNEIKLGIIKERLKDSSYKAYGILKNDKLIYSTWISLIKLGLPVKSDYVLLPNEGLLEDSYCHISERGKGLHSKMNFYRLSKLYEMGKRKCLAIVLDGNTYAFKVQTKSRFKNLGFFYAGIIFGISFTTLNKNKYDSK